MLNPSNNGISGNFTASTSVDGYLVLYTLEGTTPNHPIDATEYTNEMNSELNVYVVYNGSNNSFTDTYGLVGNTGYTYTIYEKNSSCTNEPKYLTEIH